MKFPTTLILATICLSGGANEAVSGFSSTDVTVVNAEAGISLAGTMTSPSGSAPKAAVVLASGSGAQNRDEEVMGHRPFKTIAERLSSRGYIVLRLDDRGTGESSGDFANATADDFVSDISSAVGYLDSCYHDLPVGVLGHSEGGSIAVRTSLADRRCDFIITLAAPAWPGDSIIMSQARAIACGTVGKWEAEDTERRLLDIAKSSLPDLHARTMLYAVLSGNAAEAARIPEVQKHIAASVDIIMSPHYRGLLRYDPSDDISSVTVPWLALNGDKDIQVFSGNLATIKELNPRADVILLEGHNHLFQKCTTGMIDEYAAIAGDVSDETLEAIVAWLDRLHLNQ